MTVPFLHVVLCQPEIPDNTGNVGRTCVAFGAELWLARPLGFRLEDRRLRRAGLDYCLRIFHGRRSPQSELAVSVAVAAFEARR